MTLRDSYEHGNWIDGLDATADGQLVIGTAFTNPGINLYDAATGAFSRRLPTALSPDVGIGGLKCYSPGH